jgi:general secretion pathway protein D
MISQLHQRRIARALCASAVLLSASPALAQTVPDDPARAEETVDTTFLEGEARAPVVAQPTPVLVRGGDIALNFPEADVRVVAQAVLGDLLDIEYTVADGVSGPVTVVTARPISRDSLLPFLEDAFAIAGFALVLDGGRATIERVGQGIGSGIASPGSPGFGTELLQLQFVSVRSQPQHPAAARHIRPAR